MDFSCSGTRLPRLNLDACIAWYGEKLGTFSWNMDAESAALVA